MASKATVHGAKAEGIFWVSSEDGQHCYGYFKTFIGARHEAEWYVKNGYGTMNVTEYIGVEAKDNPTGKYTLFLVVRETIR